MVTLSWIMKVELNVITSVLRRQAKGGMTQERGVHDHEGRVGQGTRAAGRGEDDSARRPP